MIDSHYTHATDKLKNLLLDLFVSRWKSKILFAVLSTWCAYFYAYCYKNMFNKSELIKSFAALAQTLQRLDAIVVTY